ncbi:hypothetical protein RHGRI_035219 [Rhododendron griersonianum]|uniref:MAPK kinase substrate protein n=1 Tax=Rhododendron griersonianum TaxID=479676 RepID=A0AAV6I6E1_9ERIC|nr:hypothetical protein RHGRI_035219 [Rhododendron griersonianum]
MAGLQRSEISFRRQGSSGLVWDDKFLNSLNQKEESQEDGAKPAADNEKDQQEPELSSTGVGPINVKIERSRSNGGGRGFRTGKVSPAIEPPSPRVSACGFCSAFGKKDNPRRRPKAGRRKM